MSRRSTIVRATWSGLVAVALAACSSQAGGGSSASTTGSAPSAPTSTDQASGSAGLTGFPIVHEGATSQLPAGTYVTTAPDGFLPGLSVTIPDGWSATEADSGEIALHPQDRQDDALLLWKDVVATVTNNRSNRVGAPDSAIGKTTQALIDWLTSTSDFDILAKPTTKTIGDDVQGTELTLTTSDTANFAWDDCPDNPRCAAIFNDPNHWGSNFYAIGGAEVARIFLTTLRYPEGDHTFVVTLDATDPDDLATFADRAQPLIDSLRVPSTYIAN